MPSSFETSRFHWADYLVFCISLLISVGIGVYFAVVAFLRPAANADLLTGGRNMSPLPVALSMVAAVVNAVLILGGPAEIHYNGTIYLLSGIAYYLVVPFAAHLLVPVFHSLDVTSAYEYLEKRYSVYLRLAGSLTFSLSILLFLSVVLYAPALAFTTVTGVDIKLITLACGAVCTLYTVLGGIKAVIWTDSVQMMIILTGLIVLPVMGAARIGSTQTIMDIVYNGSRLNFNNFSFDPRIRHTVWTQVIGNFFIALPMFGANQMIIQRYFVIESLRKAQIALYLLMFLFQIIAMLIGILGLIIYAYYSDCDPLFSIPNFKPDQIVPLFMMEILGPYHGVAGLLTASIFAAALSSAASAINSLSAVFIEDFFKPLYWKMKRDKITARTVTKLTRILSIIFGVLAIGLSYVAPLMGDKIVQLPLTIWGVTGCPLLAIFILGFFVPFCESWGALIGLVSGLFVGLWITIGNIIYGVKPKPLPLGLQCGPNGSTIIPPQFNNSIGVEDDLADFYNVSYAWYGMIAFFTSFTVAICVSFIIRLCTKSEATKIDPALMYPIDTCCQCIRRPRDDMESPIHKNGIGKHDKKNHLEDIDFMVTPFDPSEEEDTKKPQPAVVSKTTLTIHQESPEEPSKGNEPDDKNAKPEQDGVDVLPKLQGYVNPAFEESKL